MLIALNITIVLIGLILGSYLSRTVMKLLPRDVDFELQTARYKLYLQDEQEIEATQVESVSRSDYSEQEWPALSSRLKSHLSELPLSRPLHSFGLKHFIRSMLFLAFFVSWVLLAYFIYNKYPYRYIPYKVYGGITLLHGYPTSGGAVEKITRTGTGRVLGFRLWKRVREQTRANSVSKVFCGRPTKKYYGHKI